MPKKHLSQNFLYDPSILRRMIQVAAVGPEDTVVEVGPGPGRLTRMLAERASRVVAIELDRELFERLRDETLDLENLQLINADALRYPFESIAGPFKVVANIPYHITTPIIFRLMEQRPRLQSLTLTVQREVAERAAAKPGGKDYGVLSVMLQYHGRTRLRFVIPRGAFRPVPRVDSACMHIELGGRPTVEVRDERLFFAVVRAAFQQRRKTLHNSLKQLSLLADDAMRASGIDPIRRAETLSVEEFARLSDKLSELGANLASAAQV